MKYNIHTQCRIVLTKKGAERLNKFITSLPASNKRINKTYIEGDIYENTIWEIFEIFSPVLYCGATPYFLNNEIEIIENGNE